MSLDPELLLFSAIQPDPPLRRVAKWLRWNFLSPVLLFVPEGQMKPTLYGFAWRDYRRSGTIAMPVPLNVLARFLRSAWAVLVTIPWHDRGTRLDRAYWDGREAGLAVRRDICMELQAHNADLVDENRALDEKLRDYEGRVERIEAKVAEMGI